MGTELLRLTTTMTDVVSYYSASKIAKIVLKLGAVLLLLLLFRLCLELIIMNSIIILVLLLMTIILTNNEPVNSASKNKRVSMTSMTNMFYSLFRRMLKACFA